MNRRLTAVLVPVLALGLTACTGDDEKDPKTALQSSSSGLQTGNYTFTVAMPGGSSMKSVVHAPSHTAAIDLVSKTEDGDATINMRFVEPNRYMKMTADLGDSVRQLESLKAAGDDPQTAKLVDGLQAMVDMFSGKTWMKLDMSKVGKQSELALDFSAPDLTGVSDLLKTAATAERKDGDVITGTLDVTAVAGDEKLLGKSAFDGADATAGKAVAYEATLDDDDRITKLVLDMPKTEQAAAGKWTVEVTGYGSAAQQEEPPAAEVQEAPDSAYEMLQS